MACTCMYITNTASVVTISVHTKKTHTTLSRLIVYFLLKKDVRTCKYYTNQARKQAISRETIV